MLKRLSFRILLPASLLIVTLVLSGCRGAADVNTGAGPGQRQYGKVVRVSRGFYRAISAEELAEMLQTQDLMLVNVHIPYEGEIEGTDAFIPFSEIEKHLDELPQDRHAAIVLYCRRGVMSRDAAQALVPLGYTGIHDLKGGMNAWKAAGHEVLVRSQ
jgi:phage shock protein E